MNYIWILPSVRGILFVCMKCFFYESPESIRKIFLICKIWEKISHLM